MPSLGMMTVNSLVAADSVIIPSQPNFLSTKGLNLLMHSISKVKRQINPRLSIDGILLTMVDSRTNNAKDIISSLRSAMGSNIRVFDTEIPHSVRAAEASLLGKSIFSHDKNGKVAAAYENLTKEVCDIGRTSQTRSGPDWVR
jgi:chromosome partitioning protein